MARKWFQLVSEDGNALTSATSVVVDIEDVAALRHAVKKEFSDSHLAGIAAADLTVFENRAKYDAKEPLTSGSSIEAFGPSENEALIVVVRDADDEDEVTSSEYKPFYLSLLQYFMPDERNSGRVENKLSNAIKGAYPTSPHKEPEEADEEEAQALKMVAIFVVAKEPEEADEEEVHALKMVAIFVVVVISIHTE
ncbi:Crinkler (CRN) family protein [Phytophthora palmivora]|uniref:Crinkler (CRN) family protein n=1 Tax=Phytophthora palmivora TaxID=4796 RepID=A0A2P4XWI2_9STRA|nr:Crinkler (CRN) family protein [Phytophthora palmivora]